MLTFTDEKLFNAFPLAVNEYGEKIMIIASHYPVGYLFEQLGVDWEDFKQNYVVNSFPYRRIGDMQGTAYNLGYNL